MRTEGNDPCNGCGACCDPVILSYSQPEARTMGLHPEDRRWVLEDLVPIRGRELATITRWITEIEVERGDTWRGDHGVIRFGYRCRNFDQATRQCAIYDRRPPTCRRYPWPDGEPPLVGAVLPPECGYRPLVGQPVTVRTT